MKMKMPMKETFQMKMRRQTWTTMSKYDPSQFLVQRLLMEQTKQMAIEYYHFVLTHFNIRFISFLCSVDQRLENKSQ